MVRALLSLGIATTLVAATAASPFSTSTKTYTVQSLDSTDRKVDVYYPTNGSKGDTFPLISYAHGDHGGGDIVSLERESVVITTVL